MSEHSFPLAPQGVYVTPQGEGALLGVPMVFVRLAGCSVGCPECDTNYSVASRMTAHQIAARASELARSSIDWSFVTGGEPTDHAGLYDLVAELHRAGFKVALATAGIRPVQMGFLRGGADFLSVSPHRLDDSWVLRRGDQLNIVPGLNGLRLDDLGPLEAEARAGFTHCFVTPLWGGNSLGECLAWVRGHPGWRLGIQAHRYWELP